MHDHGYERTIPMTVICSPVVCWFIHHSNLHKGRNINHHYVSRVSLSYLFRFATSGFEQNRKGISYRQPQVQHPAAWQKICAASWEIVGAQAMAFNG